MTALTPGRRALRRGRFRDTHIGVDLDAPLIGVAALGLLVGAVSGIFPVLVVSTAISWILVARTLPKGGLVAALAVGLIWSNAVVVVGGSVGAPEIVGVAPQLLMLVLVLGRWVAERATIVTTTAFRMLLLYGAVLLVGGLAADVASPVLDRSLTFFLEGPLLWLLVVNVLDDRDKLRRALVAMVMAGAMLGTVTVVQYATQTFDDDYVGFGQLADDEMELYQADPTYTPRQSASIGEKNRFAQVLLTTVPFAIALSRRRRGAAAVVFALAAAGLVAGIGLSGSRGAALGMIVTVGVLAAYRVVSARNIAVLVAAAVAVMLLLPSYRERVVSIADAAGGVEDSPEEDGAVLGRVAENLAAFDIFVDHPVLGVGPGGYAYKYEDYAQTIGFNIREGPREPHNLYLGLGSELGVVGLGAFLAVVGVLLFQLHGAWRRHHDTDRAQADLAAAAMAAIAAYLVTGVFLHLSYERYLWLLLAMTDVIRRLSDHDPALPPAAEPVAVGV